MNMIKEGIDMLVQEMESHNNRDPIIRSWIISLKVISNLIPKDNVPKPIISHRDFIEEEKRKIRELKEKGELDSIKNNLNLPVDVIGLTTTCCVGGGLDNCMIPIPPNTKIGEVINIGNHSYKVNEDRKLYFQENKKK